MPFAARLSDLTAHGSPLAPGTGSLNVLIGSMPAWRGIPAAAAQGVQLAQSAADRAMRVAEQATLAAAGTPGAAAAKAAEETLKTSLSISMGSVMMAFAGTSDIHVCPIPVPIPPHGPGVVIDGCATVLINNMPACRQGDTVLESLGGADKIALGCTTVLIGGPATGALQSLLGAIPGLPRFADLLGEGNALQALAPLKNAVQEAMQSVIDALSAAVDAVVDAISSIVGAVVQAVKDAITAVKEYIQSVFGITPESPALESTLPGLEPSAGLDSVLGGKSGLKVDDATTHLSDSALSKSHGKCAKFVRQALEAGGINTDGRPVSAKDYGPFLESKGFDSVPASSFTPQAGDIVVINSIPGHPHGHIAMYDGKQWVSDFKQQTFWGSHAYENQNAEHQFYRP